MREPQPPAREKTQSATILPLSERKRILPANNGDFHVIGEVPASDSSYVRAKRVQLIDKDPNKAVSVFWSAINAGDRVDRSLKERAVVMKQLNRSDEAIEAIKSFRHLCPHDSRESLDNVLVELLQDSLHVHEKTRILGNLAWAYLQQHNYGIALNNITEKLSLEPEKNKQCNQAICLMHVNGISEAKLQLELKKWMNPTRNRTDKGKETQRCSMSHRDRTLKEASIFLPRNEENSPWCMDRRRLLHADKQNSESYHGYDDTSSQCTPIEPQKVV
ncbi:hypothetical protein V6N12_036984 [Hibiscus sabdariffa]|uniref:Uncharacterized protein n=1 Tax=Hibiscus sabdariffa TaxID=183260 RepID=A0ABR2B052_9ROSI